MTDKISSSSATSSRVIDGDLYEALCDYLHDRQDTRDGGDGTPLPNDAMHLLFQLSETPVSESVTNYEDVLAVCDAENADAKAKYKSAELIESPASMAISASAGMAATRIRAKVVELQHASRSATAMHQVLPLAPQPPTVTTVAGPATATSYAMPGPWAPQLSQSDKYGEAIRQQDALGAVDFENTLRDWEKHDRPIDSAWAAAVVRSYGASRSSVAENDPRLLEDAMRWRAYQMERASLSATARCVCGYERGAHFATSLRCPDGNGDYRQTTFQPCDDIDDVRKT